MLKYYMANADKAGVGLECLPGVKQLLQELKVCCNAAVPACTALNWQMSPTVGAGTWFRQFSS